MPNPYDKVDFKSWSDDSETYDTVCTVKLVDGKLHYEGKEAKEIKKLIDENDNLAGFREAGGYTLLAQLCRAFQGSMFYATDVQEASIL